MLLDGRRGLAEFSGEIPARDRDAIERRSVERLVRLYEAWGRPEEAEAWRARLPAGGGDAGQAAGASLPADVFATGAGR